MKNISKKVLPKVKNSIKITSLFESFKKKSKKLYCSKKLLKLQGNAKQAWKVKEIIVKAKLLHFSHLTKKITLNKID